MQLKLKINQLQNIVRVVQVHKRVCITFFCDIEDVLTKSKTRHYLQVPENASIKKCTQRKQAIQIATENMFCQF